MCGRNSAVECQLPKLDVVGSSPIARSKQNQVVANVFVTTFLLQKIISNPISNLDA